MFNKEVFNKEIKVLAIKIKAKLVSRVRECISKENILSIPRIKSVVKDTNDPECRLLLLAENVKNLEDKEKSKIKDSYSLVPYTVNLDYSHMSTNEVLSKILPANIDIPASFETVGHIAHVNLREEQLSWKSDIGTVLLDKNPHIRTVVNKVGTIDTVFRNFKMEVIGGVADFVVKIFEDGCWFQFDYSRVYWNSRLQGEHSRLVSSIPVGSTVVDMFCGVGPFAIPVAKHRKCKVYCNDLNPESVKWLKKNVVLNKLDKKEKDQVSLFNMDARDFILELMDAQKLTTESECHFIMNLPALAHEFLDIFPLIFQKYDSMINEKTLDKWIIHCYIFCSDEEDPETKIQKALGHSSITLVNIKRVRDVAPKKEMFCVSFKLPSTILKNADNAQVSTRTSQDGKETKKAKLH